MNLVGDSAKAVERFVPSRANLRSGLTCSVRKWVIKQEQLEDHPDEPEEPKWTHSRKPNVDFNKV